MLAALVRFSPVIQQNIRVNDKKTINTVSFGSSLNNDIFVPQVEIMEGDIPENQAKAIIKEIDKGTAKLSSGMNSDFYRIGEYAIKTTKVGGLDSAKDADYAKEAFALDYVKKAGLKGCPELNARLRKGNKYYLVTNFMQGKPLDFKSGNNLNKEHLENLMSKFAVLDKSGLIHFDLCPSNLLLHDRKVNIIDFNCFDVLGDDGKYLQVGGTSYGIHLLKNETKSDVAERVFKVLKKDNGDYNFNYSDNPHFRINSNLTNFEFRTLSNYMEDFAQKDPNTAKAFYVDYLKTKSDYHLQTSEHLQKLAELATDKDVQQELKEAINHENFSAKILKNPSDQVVKIELSKMSLKSLLFELLYVDNKTPKEGIKQIYQGLVKDLNPMGITDKAFNKYCSNNLKTIKKLESWVSSFPSPQEGYDYLRTEKNLLKMLKL